MLSLGAPAALGSLLAGPDPLPPRRAEPCLAERFLPEPASADARFGGAVAIDAAGSLAIGVPGRDEVRIGSVDRSAGLARIERTLRGPAGSRFGASLALDGGLLVIGAPDSAPGGAAYLHDLADPASAAIELRPAAASAGARAGHAVAIRDGTILVGAPEHSEPGHGGAGPGATGAPSGAVFVFAAPAAGGGMGGGAGGGAGAPWIELAALLPFDGGSEGGFGEAIALDPTHIAVGAPRGSGARDGTGVAYLFARGSAAGVAGTAAARPLARIELPDGVADEAFGAALAFAAGDLAIGVPYRDAAAPAAGAVALLSAAAIGAAAASAPAARIAPDRLLARAASPTGAALGSSLAAAGETIAAGAPADGGAAPLAGAIALFARDGGAGALAWRERARLGPDPAAAGSDFGRAIALATVASGSGSAFLLLAGAPGDPERCGGGFGCDAGSAALAIIAGGADCDRDGVPDPCARRADPTLDADGDGALDRCRFRRGDLDGDGALTLADPVLWLTETPPGGDCPAAADANGDGALDLADPVALLEHLFQGAPAPPPPFPGCGTEETGGLGCAGRGCEGEAGVPSMAR